MDDKPKTAANVVMKLLRSEGGDGNELDSVFKVSGSANAIRTFKASIEKFKRSIL